MAQAADYIASDWTAADLVERFGAIPLHRIRFDPPPGEATEDDVLRIHDRSDRLCELVDGVLVEKTVGIYESYLAVLLTRLLGNHIEQNQMGIVLGADGMARLSPGLVRIPDACFISWERLPDRRVPQTPMLGFAPDLAAEVISPSNTRKEMARKLEDYFKSGVRLVWYFYPKTRECHAFQSSQDCVILREDDTLSGGDVVPGFSLRLRDFFAQPERPKT